MEGVHCDKHDCIIENVWWDDVCEDALSVKSGTASSVTKVIGGGARYADDKVIQHNGFGTVDIDGFYGEDISKLYRSCGTCGNRPKKVSASNTYVLNPTNAIVTVNKNWGDQATLRNVWVKSSKPTVKVCQWSQGNANGEPKMLGHGPSNPLCKYSESDQTVKNTTASVPDGTWPASTGIVRYKKPYTIKAGEVFDGKMQIFERSDITCSGGEGQKDTAVFLVEAGGTLKNAIIGKNQKEGVHCDYHDCTIENVWWDDVCEDALSIKGGSASSVTTVTNCGARYAEDKVVQHNGYGTVKIKGFFAQEFDKLYRSTCTPSTRS
ncbi:polysaccharide lyase, putative [Phytophthora infestans T30-4]|uniref:Probable pectate lyase F n=1 Tax=Phytophthora infestans (strain T30-4) TaxID=403677 RepID=D0NV97_PHYIT|nr:polysaccharide lyase, putative [Phytophthora infestans T30-4]EEY66569.1 polysaccharide lyase, putative [Phytophthora infestans T30-4]|eukprot:XP_002897088.1 polysaccharide lyase, putative [Phytophthora infestans T30-4]